MEAVNTHNPHVSKLPAHAKNCMRSQHTKYQREEHIPVHINLRREINKAEQTHFLTTGERLQNEELAARLGKNLSVINEAQSLRLPTLSLDAPDEETGLTLLDRTPASTRNMPCLRAEEAEKKKAVHALVGSLPSDLALVVRESFFHDKTTEEIAKEIGMSETTVKRRLRDAREALGNKIARNPELRTLFSPAP